VLLDVRRFQFSQTSDPKRKTQTLWKHNTKIIQKQKI